MTIHHVRGHSLVLYFKTVLSLSLAFTIKMNKPVQHTRKPSIFRNKQTNITVFRYVKAWYSGTSPDF